MENYSLCVYSYNTENKSISLINQPFNTVYEQNKYDFAFSFFLDNKYSNAPGTINIQKWLEKKKAEKEDA